MRVLLIASPAGGPPDIAHADALVLAHPPGTAPDWLAPLRRRPGAPPLYVRVAAGAADLDAALALGPDGIVLPRIADGTAIARLGVRLAVHEAEAGLPDGATRIVAGLDGARALLRFASPPQAFPRLAGLFCAWSELAHDLGVSVSADAPWPAPLAQARGLLVLAAAAAGVPALDVPPFDMACPSAGSRAARAARCDGFRGGFAEDAAAAVVLAAAFRSGPRDAAPVRGAAGGSPGRGDVPPMALGDRSA